MVDTNASDISSFSTNHHLARVGSTVSMELVASIGSVPAVILRKPFDG
jgi:hypothetical protein